MENTKAKMLFEKIEISVAVEQGMSAGKTKRRDQAVDGLANGVASRSEETIVLRRGDSQCLASGVEDLKFGHVPANSREGGVSANSLEHLAQD